MNDTFERNPYKTYLRPNRNSKGVLINIDASRIMPHESDLKG